MYDTFWAGEWRQQVGSAPADKPVERSEAATRATARTGIDQTYSSTTYLVTSELKDRICIELSEIYMRRIQNSEDGIRINRIET